MTGHKESDMEPKSKGQIGYEAYAAFTGGKTFDGRDMPTWEQVKASGTKVADAWEAAARAILAQACRKCGGQIEKDVCATCGTWA
jgi:hypothetical protein